MVTSSAPNAAPFLSPGPILEEDEDSESSFEEYNEDEVAKEGSTDPSTASSGGGQIQIATSEAQAVKTSKIAVYIALFVFAIAASAIVGYYVKTEENEVFESEFKVFSSALLDGANNKAKIIFRQLDTLGTSVTSHALDLNLEFPFVTLPHFFEKTEELVTLSGTEFVVYAPLISLGNLEKWGNYVETNATDIKIDAFGRADFPGSVKRDIGIFPQESFQETTNLTLSPHEFLVPALQYGPNATSAGLINTNLKSHPVIQRAVRSALAVKHPVLSGITDLSLLLEFTTESTAYEKSPQSAIIEPVYDSFDEPRRMVGLVLASEPWSAYLRDNLPENVRGLMVVVEDTCDGVVSFHVDGATATFMGYGDDHDSQYDYLAQTADFATFSRFDGELGGNINKRCDFTLTVYPDGFQSDYESKNHILFASAVFAMFLFTVSFFAAYDWTVSRQTKKVLGAATRTTKIVQSLFPKDIGNRIIEEAERKSNAEQKKGNQKLRTFLNEGGNSSSNDPIAELYTDTTICFADIVGFTAWSSARQPKEVFHLLESIYHEFDQIADHRRVFKVETVGDCYVAVAGLPNPRADHAVAMIRFAQSILLRFQVQTHQLEVDLGPDTGDLSLRVGLHSGPVTAGVLRGDRSRFQLFGDTVNTASRMESTGKPSRIHISQETADLLNAAGKGHWVRPREDRVVAKGKGELSTFWVEVKSGDRYSTTSGSSNDDQKLIHEVGTPEPSRPTKAMESQDMAKEDRLCRWNTEILGQILCDLRDSRSAVSPDDASEQVVRQLELGILNQKGSSRDELVDILDLRGLEPFESDRTETNDLDSKVKTQLHEFVRSIASLYRNNSFDGFEHASHVTMSVVKLISRITSGSTKEDHEEKTIKSLVSHPLVLFACALSALVHDLDHQGVTNGQLIKEGHALAQTYENKSVAEQHSVDLAWHLLMQEEYKDLRKAIYSTEAEFRCFRQVVCNLVLATDIFDKDLGKQRKERWVKAFTERRLGESETQEDLLNLKATIVVEHLLQASDVAHTMQHFQIFKKWNERLFIEMYRAYKEGRADKDPSEGWFEGETWFFENYIIPLAKKLKECGVFGVAGNEYLLYATKNKAEWEAQGQALVEEYKQAAIQSIQE